MKIGITMPHQVANVDPTIIPEWARRAEAAGFATLGSVGRIAYPTVMDTVALAAAAGVTSTIGLFSGVFLGTVWPSVLLAKEMASIDGISGGRLTAGLGAGVRADDFVVPGRPMTGLGKRMDADLATYFDVWDGKPLANSTEPAVPAGTRRIPLIFGGFAPATFARAARVGQGYIGAALPAPYVVPAFDAMRGAWQEAGREGTPSLRAIGYFNFGDPDVSTKNIHDYYKLLPDFVGPVVANIAHGPQRIKDLVKSFEDIGADEYMLNPTTADLDQIERLAEAVL